MFGFEFKQRVDLTLLKSDVQTKSDEEINELILPFLLHCYPREDNHYNYKDCRKAVNICIRELIKRGYEEEEIIEWSDKK